MLNPLTFYYFSFFTILLIGVANFNLTHLSKTKYGINKNPKQRDIFINKLDDVCKVLEMWFAKSAHYILST